MHTVILLSRFLVLLVFAIFVVACGDSSTSLPSSGGAGNVSSRSLSPVATTEAMDEQVQDENEDEGSMESSPSSTNETYPEYVTRFVDVANVDFNNPDMDAGKHLYQEVCAPCHGLEATGIAGIDINLVRSKFVGGADVKQLTVLLIKGLSINNPFNVTEIRMPPRGGRDDLNDQDMVNIAAYLKDINTQQIGEQRVSAYFDWLGSDAAQEAEEIPEVGQEGLTGAALDGQTTYLRFCAVCHGPNAEGVESLGKGFRGSEYIADLNDEELAEFITIGRADDDPLNETGIEMLPFGGQPYLTEEQLDNLVAYIRTVESGTFVPPIPSDVEGFGLASMDGVKFAKQAYQIIDNTTPRCFACHVIADRGNQNGPGPNLNGLNEIAGERVEGLSAEEYVEQAILDPGAFLVAECPRGPCVDVMSKNYADKLSEEQVRVLVQFLLSLPAD